MEPNELNLKQLIKSPSSGILSYVANKAKGKVLFPQKVEAAKRYLKRVKITNA